MNIVAKHGTPKTQRTVFSVWSSLSAEWTSTRYGCQSCSTSGEHGISHSSRVRVWSDELCSDVPSRPASVWCNVDKLELDEDSFFFQFSIFLSGLSGGTTQQHADIELRHATVRLGGD